MLRTISACERSTVANDAVPVVLAAAVAGDIIPNQVVEPKNLEIAARYIQNVGNNDVFVAFGMDASPNTYHAKVSAGQQLECGSRLRVNGYSTAGTTVAVLIFFRANGNNAALPQP